MSSVIDARAFLDTDAFKSAQVSVDQDAVEFDIGHLMLSSLAPLESSDKEEGKLQSIGRDHVQMLINTLFTRPSKPIRNEVGRLVSLPEPTLILPREKPLPKPKPLTKWEKFAKTKGIQKRKRGRMVWDEERQGWAPRWGANRANDDSKMWAMEAVPGEDASVDPWTSLKQAKKERVAKNEKQRLSNLKAAGGRSAPGQIDLHSAIKAKPLKRNKLVKEQRQEQEAIEKAAKKGIKNSQLGKRKHDDAEHLKVSLRVAQNSTASMGKFEAYRKDEPTRPDVAKRQRRNNLVEGADEKKKSLSLLSKVLGD